jgi:hypothetical protein
MFPFSSFRGRFREPLAIRRRGIALYFFQADVACCNPMRRVSNLGQSHGLCLAQAVKKAINNRPQIWFTGMNNSVSVLRSVLPRPDVSKLSASLALRDRLKKTGCALSLGSVEKLDQNQKSKGTSFDKSDGWNVLGRKPNCGYQ